MRTAGSLLALLILTASAFAQNSFPMVTHVTPVAVQRGTYMEPLMTRLLKQAQVLSVAPPQTRAETQLSFAPVVRKVVPAVVNVYASRVEQAARNPLFDDPVFRQFFGGGLLRFALHGDAVGHEFFKRFGPLLLGFGESA